MDFSCIHHCWKPQLVGLKLRGIKVALRRKEKVEATSVQFVKILAIIGPAARGVTRRTLLLWWKWGNKMLLFFYSLLLLVIFVTNTLLCYYHCSCSCRGPPKKKAKKTKTTQSSIVPWEGEAPAASMSFPLRWEISYLAAVRKICLCLCFNSKHLSFLILAKI